MALSKTKLYDVHLDYRTVIARGQGTTFLCAARLRDPGYEIGAVAKVTLASGEEEEIKLVACAEIHRSLHDHPGILKVHGIVKMDPYFVLLMEKALGKTAIRDSKPI